MKKWMVVMLLGAVGVGCNEGPDKTVGGGGDEDTYTKSEARALNGVDEDGVDICDFMDWYGDGECDDFCTDSDDDCKVECTIDGDCAPGYQCFDGFCARPGDGNNGANNGSNNGTNNGSNNGSNNGTNNGSNNGTNNGTGLPDGSPCAADADCSGGSCIDGVCGSAPTMCGGIAGLACPDGWVCDFADESCGAADQLGTCIELPEACTEEYAPVCGCDGQTHSNACFAHGAGTDVAYVGECGAPACESDLDCGRGEVCLDGVCTTQGGGQCGGFAGFTCNADEWCDYPDDTVCGQADFLGQCLPKPLGCPDNFDPVCGCDGQTHSNECDAHAAGVDVAYAGECQTFCSDNSQCSSGESCVDGVCRGVCGGFAGFTCGPNEWCDYADNAMCGAADQMGICEPSPDACTTIYDPVCGCDFQTYSNACFARIAGVDVASQGPCT